MTNADIVLGLLLAAACWLDAVSRKIPNPLIVIGLVAGLGVSNVVGGLSGAGNSALGALAGLLAFLPFFALRWMGAGDVKLLAVAGAFAGVPGVLLIAVYTAIAGGILGLAARLLVGAGLLIRAPSVRSGATAEASGAGDRSEGLRARIARGSVQLPYAFAIAAGSAAWMLTR